MKPLQSVAMGLVIVALSARVDGYDLLADPLGWLLVLVGVRALPRDLAHRGNLLGLATLAGAVAVVLWFPVVTEDLYDADASLGWAANLPQIVFSALLCQVLAARAAGAGDGRGARWFGVLRTATVLIGLLPVLVFGAGLESLEVTSYLAAGLVAILLVYALFAHASRSWAAAEVAETPAVVQPPS